MSSDEQKEYWREYNSTHREAVSAKNSRSYQAHREARLAKMRRYREQHREQFREYGRRYRAAHPQPRTGRKVGRPPKEAAASEAECLPLNSAAAEEALATMIERLEKKVQENYRIQAELHPDKAIKESELERRLRRLKFEKWKIEIQKIEDEKRKQ